MTGRGFSRRDLLNLGGKLVMSVGAVKLVAVLPGCGGSDSTSIDAGIDAPKIRPDGGYATLDDCHKIGTYHYPRSYPGTYPYTYHYYYSGSYGCPSYLYYGPAVLDCYPDYHDFAPGYPWFCYSSYYVTTTNP
jgi:hypothetical protein